MDSNINVLEKIRNNVISMLIKRNYNKNVLENLNTVNHADFIKLYKNNSINIKVKHNLKNEIAIVYFYNYREKKIKKEDLTNIIDSIKADMNNDIIYNLILVVKEKPHSLILKRIANINTNTSDDDDLENMNIEIFYHSELKINITEHVLVPKHILLNESEKNKVISTYKSKEIQMPQYAINDAVVKYYGLKHGDMVKIIRNSKTSGSSIYYRIVNKNVTI